MESLMWGGRECEIGRGFGMMAILVSFACSFAPGEEGEARGSNNCSSPACLSVWKGMYMHLPNYKSSSTLSIQQVNTAFASDIKVSLRIDNNLKIVSFEVNKL